MFSSPLSPLQTLTEFSKKHKGHVARLCTEAQDLVRDLEVVGGEYYRAKGAYEEACIQASRYAATTTHKSVDMRIYLARLSVAGWYGGTRTLIVGPCLFCGCAGGA